MLEGQYRALLLGLLTLNPALSLRNPPSGLHIAESVRSHVGQEKVPRGRSIAILVRVIRTAKFRSFIVAIASNVITHKGSPPSSPLRNSKSNAQTLQSIPIRSATPAITLLTRPVLENPY